MWLYRRLLRVSWKEKRTNESILQELAAEREVLQVVSSRRLRYVGHAVQNKNTNLMTTVMQGKLEAKRRSGRPPTTYLDNIKKKVGMSLQEMSHACMNREGWRKIVSG